MNYVKGRTYPAIFDLYETFFDNGFNGRAAFLANHGYAVFHPSVSREIYYALRRLGREVEWVRYVHGAHRPPDSVPEAIDFEQRMLDWWDRHLQTAPPRQKSDAPGML